MQITAATFALFAVFGLVSAAAVPEPEPLNIVERDVNGPVLLGRAFTCGADDPAICCACRGGQGICVNLRCECVGGNC
ncbi:hypothetical protein BKA67DRAFT_663034 [Truncatella angustata]|uniref:Uncharacterized protein n=1 Tax=Truncatella angustata TaxID=152316 RepID=A0A9P8RIF9_9PEZI|nr:uncharacterized protein BKA67DRAFT_663034 [Truncatella angustata]KAH6646629.1 hypothetical protein BKA67DRAFT_663034 [Truncatella angustata]KAH8204178.1 hypothetical protein TruAng_001598 [Truncatella angustata]